jgi:hypothetical protein
VASRRVGRKGKKEERRKRYPQGRTQREERRKRYIIYTNDLGLLYQITID